MLAAGHKEIGIVAPTGGPRWSCPVDSPNVHTAGAWGHQTLAWEQSMDDHTFGVLLVASDKNPTEKSFKRNVCKT